jgi:hypothetical protein
LTGARTHHERALEIDLATLGSGLPNIAIFRRNLDNLKQQLAVRSAKTRFGRSLGSTVVVRGY